MVRTILLIDADLMSITRIRRALGRAGFHVQLALDGRSGVNEFRRLRPDLTLLHDTLPVMDGLEACRRMKQRLDATDRRVVILTSPRNHDVLFETGCDAYIEKPFDEAELLDVVRELLSRPRGRVAVAEIDLPVRASEIPASPIPLALTEDDLDSHLERVLGDPRQLVPVEKDP